MDDQPQMILAPAEDFILDRAIIDTLETTDQKVISAIRYGHSKSQTARITTVSTRTAQKHECFLKIDVGDYATPRALAEYTCMNELYNTMPSIVPRPRAHGRCIDTNASFFISDYLEISHRMPDPVELGCKIAELHKKSVSPTGMFGFHVPPYDGTFPLATEWDSSWMSFYQKLLKRVYEQDTHANGNWEPFDRAMELTLQRVIPRLLGPLEEDGRSVKPCLIHGDLWEGNIGTDPQTGAIYIFDSCAYYAHHEMGIGMWRVEHHRMTAKEYREEYFRNYAPDEPVQEWDDRNRLYSLKELLIYSAHFPEAKARKQALVDMEFLIGKYGVKK